MNVARVLFLSICCLAGLHPALAQEQLPTQPPVAAETPVSPNFTDQIRRTVTFITVAYQNGSNAQGVIGTGFFVFLPDERLGQNRGFIYLVTNRHVAQPGIDAGTPYPVSGLFLRLNLATAQGAVQSVQEQVPLNGEFHWYFPTDDSVDLAVLPVAPDQNRYAYQMIPDSMIVSASQVKAGDVVVGDHVTFAGYFSNFPGQIRIEPIVREGVIAMMPDENLDTTLRKPGRLYLADLHAFHGNSGSPVFVNVASTAHHGVTMLGEKYLLLGLISGYYPESVGFTVPAATVLTGEVRDNSGIATIVPAQEVDKLLKSAELQADRDRQAAQLGKQP